jgi:hypothetical protein
MPEVRQPSARFPLDHPTKAIRVYERMLNFVSLIGNIDGNPSSQKSKIRSKSIHSTNFSSSFWLDYNESTAKKMNETKR